MINPFGDSLLSGPPDEPSVSSPPQRSPFGDAPVQQPKPSAEDNVIAATLDGADADAAAKSAKVGQQLGVPPSIVDLDPERYNADATRKQALDVVARNKDIANWVQKTPFNAKLAGDDLEKLDRVVQAVRNLSQQRHDFSRIKQALDEGIGAGWGDTPLGISPEDNKWFEDHGFWKDRGQTSGPFNYLAVNLFAIPTQFAFRTLKGAMYGGTAAWKQLLSETGLPRDVVGMLGGEYFSGNLPIARPPAAPTLQYAVNRLRGISGRGVIQGEILDPMLRLPDSEIKQPPPPAEPPTIDLGRGEYEDVKQPGFQNPTTAEPHIPHPNLSTELAIRENERPRPGTDWLADQIHMETAEGDRQAFDGAFQAAQETALRERSPEALADLLRHTVGNRSFYIPSEIVDKFYHDAVPHGEDNVFGWLDNAHDKISTSLALGTDLQVPMAQALAHMDPAVYTAIKDFIRFNEVGVNAEEAKVLKDQEPEDYPVDTVAPQAPTELLAKLKPDMFEVEPPPVHPELHTEPLPFGSAMHEVNVRTDFNKRRTLSLLGPSRYEKMWQMGEVTLKELLQNSFDAVKDYMLKNSQHRGKIDITADKDTRTIVVHDNGVGMDESIIGDKFWEVAGSQKESEDSSGGFGISKLLWQHNNTGLRVYTLKNGVLTTVKTNGDAVHEAFTNPNAPVKMDPRLATKEDLKMFPDGHGTRIEIDIPANYKRNGELQAIEFPTYLPWVRALTKSPLFHDIEVTFNKEKVDIGKNFPADKFTQFANVKFAWGKVRIYVSKGEYKQGGHNVHVLSNGIWQFSDKIANNPMDPYGQPIPKEFYIDIKPDVEATDNEYPFDMNRQRFSKTTEEDFKKIYRYIQALYRQVDLQASSRNFGYISELVTDDAIGGVREVNKRKLEPPLPPRETVATAISEGDSIEVKDGKLIVKGREIPELTQKELEDTHINLDELKVPQKDIDPRAVLLHDNVEIDSPATTKLREITDRLEKQVDELDKTIDFLSQAKDKKLGAGKIKQLQAELDTAVSQLQQARRLRPKGDTARVSLVDAGRVAFGDRFNEYLHYIGKVFHGLRDFVADELEYPALKDEGIGISFDQKYYGVSIRIPFSGTFINPAIAAERGPRRVALDMIHTMIHELAHHKVRDHDAAFADEMQKIKVYVEEARLYNSNKYDIGQVARGMIEHMEKNSDVFDWLTQQLKSGAPSTRGKRLKGAESAGGGGGLPDDAGKDQLAGGEGDVSPAESGGARGAGTDVDQGEGERPASEERDELFESPEEYGQRIKEERAAVETDLTLAVKRERRALYLDPLFKDPKSAGMDAVQFGRYSRRIAEADQAAYEKALEKAKALVKKRLTPEWKHDREQIKEEVSSDLKSLPMVVADRYIRLGELPTGELVERRKLDEQAVAELGGEDLGRYTVKRGGMPPDDVAPFLQFKSGAELVEALNQFDQGRKRWDESKGPNAYLNHLIDKETDERMERRYGSLQENILDEARDLVTTASHLDILTDEMKQLAQMAGLPFEKNSLPDHVDEIFQKVGAQEVSYEKFRRGAEQQAKVAEKALLKGGYREAFQAKLRQYTNVLMAKEAKAFEKKVATAERNFRKISRKDSRPGIDQDYYDMVRKVLNDVGFAKIDGQEPIKSIGDMLNESSGQLAVAPWIADATTKRAGMAYPNLTVEEFNALNNSIRSLLHVGGEYKKIDSTHGAANRDNVIFDIRRSLERFGVRPPKERQGLVRRAGGLANFVTAAHTLVERIFDYTDQFDPNGPITRFIDRPLRDAYKKELELIEQVVGRLKKMEEFTDNSVNDSIKNNYITDPIDGQSLPMTRKNLRMMMLHMGSDSGIKKITEGFNIDIISAFNLIRENATKADFAWVNRMHEIFDFLWKPASEMQRRYTGVESDPILARPFKMKLKDGAEVESTGGYAPVFYDKTRSNIEGDLSLKSDLFDKHYVAAVPAHGYTMPRTSYVGWVDLNGTLMPSRIYQMVHDIAFREAVRNAQKVITDKDFNLAMNQYWGPQYASLLPSWLKDIANIHNTDDAFAQGFARFLSTTRQNVTNTLIAFNPGTVMKHGLTALSMSLAQTTVGGLAGAIKNLGVPAILQSARDLMRSEKVVLTPDERANIIAVMKDPDTREFIINSSALFRNRSRSYPDTIRGAYERASEAGALQTVRNLQVISERAGRFGVALSDMVSAMPVWLAAYKDAIARTGDHADAVFEADRVTTRAHGSSFYGDKPAVMRLGNTATGELAKSFVSLYNFWNHMGNNVLQWAWDAESRGRRGAGAEPGADFSSLLQRVFLYAVVPILVEELASPALDDDKHSFGYKGLMATLRYFGGMIVGLREFTNGIAHGYEPSVGMLGTFTKAIYNSASDLTNNSRNKITHAFTALGIFGVPFASQQVGRTAQGIIREATGQERPYNFEERRALWRKGYIRPRR